MSDWTPRESDKQWARDLVAMLKDGGTWAAPVMGFFIVDKTAKTFTMTTKSFVHEADTLQRTVKCFKAIGYEVIDKSGE